MAGADVSVRSSRASHLGVMASTWCSRGCSVRTDGGRLLSGVLRRFAARHGGARAAEPKQGNDCELQGRMHLDERLYEVCLKASVKRSNERVVED